MSGENSTPNDQGEIQSRMSDSAMFGYKTDWIQDQERAQQDVIQREKSILATADRLLVPSGEKLRQKSLIQAVIDSKTGAEKNPKYPYFYEGIIAQRLKETFQSKEVFDLLLKGWQTIKPGEYEQEITELENGTHERELRQELDQVTKDINKIIEETNDYSNAARLHNLEAKKRSLLRDIKHIPSILSIKKEELEAIPDFVTILEKLVNASS